MNRWKDSTAGWLGAGSWKYFLSENGERLEGETRERTSAQVAQDFAMLAKRRFAEEQRSRAKPDPNPDKATNEAVAAEIKAWLTGPLVLERAQHSVAAKVLPEVTADYHVILIQHDWASAFAGAKIEGDGEKSAIRLPYPLTVFEFQFRGGVRAIVLTRDNPNEPDKPLALVTFKTKSGFARLGDAFDDIAKRVPQNPLVRVVDLIDRTIAATCIMLEAQVAEIEPLREPYRRNAPKIEGAKPQKYNHHILVLSRRPRPLPPSEPGEPGTPKRLHFRRGHWRHFATHKTWIRWTLVGNPDLGFVDKDYSL